tara:strand:- start:111 stop:428 length:318 start_codon:yes stop_codon:yes gene_type:complete
MQEMKLKRMLDKTMTSFDTVLAERKELLAEREAHIATIDMLRRKLKLAGCDVAAFPAKLETCVICLGEIEVQSNGWAGGHNAMPVAEGQCCDDCHGQVLAERFRR